jgi:hypothetical protein
VLVARTSARGLHALQQPLTDIARGTMPHGLQVLAVVLVADSPKAPPRAVRGAIRAIHGVAPAVLHLPWVERWRADPDSSQHCVGRVTGKLQDLREKSRSPRQESNRQPEKE